MKNTSRYYIGECIKFLNDEIKKLETELDNGADNEALSLEIRGLYDLKADVLLKLMRENKAKVSNHYYNDVSCYSFKLNRIHSFHLTKSNQIRKAVRNYEREHKKKECPKRAAESVFAEESVIVP